MAHQISDDLSPSDGLSNIWLEEESVSMPLEQGAAREVNFRFVLRSRDGYQQLGSLSLSVPMGDSGMPELWVRAYDTLIAALRQGLYTSDMMRSHHRKELERWNQAKS